MFNVHQHIRSFRTLFFKKKPQNINFSLPYSAANYGYFQHCAQHFPLSAADFSTSPQLTDTADNYCSFAEIFWLQPHPAVLIERPHGIPWRLATPEDSTFQHLSIRNTYSWLCWAEDLAPKKVCSVFLLTSTGITQVNIQVLAHTLLILAIPACQR